MTQKSCWQVFTKNKKAWATPYHKCPMELARIITCYCGVPKHDKLSITQASYHLLVFQKFHTPLSSGSSLSVELNLSCLHIPPNNFENLFTTHIFLVSFHHKFK